uniref:Irregular chiasm C-roughest protein n=1 Tax=Aceria tosichella TaxID=561515 RepID=A0A6G1SPM2_9ACAR
MKTNQCKLKPIAIHKRIHKRRRKKRKLLECAPTTSVTLTDPPLQATTINNHKPLYQATTTTTIKSHQRRPQQLVTSRYRTAPTMAPTITTTKTTPATVRSFLRFAWLMLTISQLLCDTAQVEHSARSPQAQAAELEASSDSDANGPSIKYLSRVLDDRADNRQRFLEEPQDVYAVVGQQVALSCAVLAKRGMMTWRTIAYPAILVTDEGVMENDNQIFVTLERYSLATQAPTSDAPEKSAAAQPTVLQRDNQPDGGAILKEMSTSPPAAAASNSGQQRPIVVDDDTIVSNYTMHIRNVTLLDDDHYQCSVGEVDRSHRRIDSRQARLNVLQPPAKLELILARITSANGTETDYSGMDPQDTPLGSTPDQSENSLALDPASDSGLQVRTLEVEENDRIRFECKTSHAKPAAEIFWLDASTGQPVDTVVGSSSQAQSADEQDQEPVWRVDTHSVRERVGEHELERTISVLSIRADRRLHHNRVFICQTKHKAYELEMATTASNGVRPSSSSSWSMANLRPLQQGFKLSILYRPQVELIRDQMQPTEMLPIKFKCLVDARPAALNYSWFVDEQRIEHVHEPELSISQLTRQLHLREIKCEATNSVGSGSATVRLAVKYSPAYVTHLLPASLQPDFNVVSIGSLLGNGAGGQQQQSTSTASGSHSLAPAGRRSDKQQEAPVFEKVDPWVSRELAVGGVEHQSVTLRCDFDSNPAPERIQWYKISTEFSTMKDVTPAEADELIAEGANHALFRRETSRSPVDEFLRPVAAAASFTPTKSSQQLAHDHNKRHIKQPGGGIGDNEQHYHQQHQQYQVDETSWGGDSLSAKDRVYQLDLERMSRELMNEMHMLELEQLKRQKLRADELRASSNNNNGTTKSPEQSGGAGQLPVFIEPIDSEPISQSNTHKIYEPLAFLAIKTSQYEQQLEEAAQRQWNIPHGTRLSAKDGQPGPAFGETITTTTTTTNVLAGADGSLEHDPLASTATSSQTEVILLEGKVAIAYARELLARNSTLTNQQRLAGGGKPAITTIKRRALIERQAQLTSSSVRLKSVSDESTGKYVCLAKAQDGFETMAKSVYFVLKREPRIISEKTQWAPLAAHQVQVECLAQINTVQDNQTRIQWFKDGKLIEVMKKTQNGKEKQIIIKNEFSPDALFMRSTLHIHGAEYTDFGQYNCNITNSRGTDSMPIFLQPTAATGYAFKVLATVTLGSVVLLVLSFCIMMALRPCRRFDSLASGKSGAGLKGKSVVVMADGKAHLTADPMARNNSATTNSRSSNSPSSQSNHSAAKRSINSSEASTITRQDEPDDLPPPGAITSMATRQQLALMNGGGSGSLEGAVSASQLQSSLNRPESAMGSGTFGLAGYGATGSLRGRFTRASLRSENNYQAPVSARNLSMQQHHHQSSNPTSPPSRFAAIHETLEHKLQFGSAANGTNFMLAQPNAGGGSGGGGDLVDRPGVDSDDGQRDHNSQLADNNQVESSVTLSDSSGHEIDSNASLANNTNEQTRTSLIDKIRNKFKSGSAASNGSAQTNSSFKTNNKQASLGRSTSSGKSRPTISMPIGGVVSGSGGNRLRRSSLSNSMTLVSDHNNQTKSPLPAGAIQMKHSMMMRLNQINGGTESNLVSSSANLIQGSGTTSDGTTSGRSSSTSNHPNGQQHRLHQQQQTFVAPVNLAYQHHPQQQWNQQVQLGSSNCDNNILYANSTNLYDMTNDHHHRQQQQQLYANGYPQATIDPTSMEGPYGHYKPQCVVYTTGQPEDQQYQHQPIQATNEHYQMPMLMSEQYLAAAVAAAVQQQQQEDRPCYATICNGVNKMSLYNHQEDHSELI